MWRHSCQPRTIDQFSLIPVSQCIRFQIVCGRGLFDNLSLSSSPFNQFCDIMAFLLLKWIDMQPSTTKPKSIVCGRATSASKCINLLIGRSRSANAIRKTAMVRHLFFRTIGWQLDCDRSQISQNHPKNEIHNSNNNRCAFAFNKLIYIHHRIQRCGNKNQENIIQTN